MKTNLSKKSVDSIIRNIYTYEDKLFKGKKESTTWKKIVKIILDTKPKKEFKIRTKASKKFIDAAQKNINKFNFTESDVEFITRQF